MTRLPSNVVRLKGRTRKTVAGDALQRAFMSLEPGLRDLVRAVDLALLAKAAEEDGMLAGDESAVGIALEDLKRRAVLLEKDWYVAHHRVFGQAVASDRR
jgi:hypothetical protein